MGFLEANSEAQRWLLLVALHRADRGHCCCLDVAREIAR
jgi:hypothetical protein